jgi:two-component system chemotaxis response regulator CheY
MTPRVVLIVDDSASIRALLTQVLNWAGFVVIEGDGGEAGLAHLRRCPVDLIITDLNMPAMDGLAFIREVRTLEAHLATPILMLTTENSSAARQAALLAGATGFASKPFAPADLLAAVSRQLS